MFLPYSPAAKAGICVGLLSLFLCSLLAFLDMIQPSTHQESPDFFSAFLSPLLLCPACCFPSTCCYLEIRTIFLRFG